MNSPVSPPPLAGLANLMVWLGGGNWRDIDEHAERSAYQTAGFFVAVNAVVAGSVVSFVLGLAGVPGPAGWLFAIASGLLVGAIGRALATAPADPAPGRSRGLLGDLARGLVAVLIGVLLGELAALAIFAGAIDRELNSSLDVAGTSVSQSAQARQLGALQADRAALDTRVDDATARRDRSLVVARCEYHPGPGCPSTQITGDPGHGPEAAQANTDLAAAEHDLAEAATRRDQLAPGLDRDIADARAALGRDTARAESLAAADTGLDARWAAMNSYTTHTAATAGPLVLRIAVVVLFVLLNLLPLILRRWRGQTDQDRRILARKLRNRAEEEADTTVAISRAQLRAALELDRHRALLASGSATALGSATASGFPASGSATSLDPASAREGETPLDAGTPLGRAVTRAELTAPAGPEPVPAARELAGSRLPALAEQRAPAPTQSSPLDLLPGPLPGAVRAITGLVRPLVPAPVARLADAAPRSIKIARGLWEEVEEFQFTMLRKRTVRLASDEIDEAAEAGPAGAGAAAGSPTAPAATWAQADLVVHPPATRPAAALSDAAAHPEVTGRGPGEVAGRRRGAVKGRARRELPPASED
ncbi:MAG TPA: DUF4407 domain-containing protein [Pseudonocardia sp.]|nr:DUF4407 domain-containing protein [Pseudonocardia sp.]